MASEGFQCKIIETEYYISKLIGDALNVSISIFQKCAV